MFPLSSHTVLALRVDPCGFCLVCERLVSADQLLSRSRCCIALVADCSAGTARPRWADERGCM
eukprot:3089975-Pleurochrysis_carterae.AAC.1